LIKAFFITIERIRRVAPGKMKIIQLLRRKWILSNSLFVILFGLIIPQRFTNPVEGANQNSYHPKAFWYFPWGKSGVHKGVDIFAKEGTNVNSSIDGLVIYAGNFGIGGNVVAIIGPKWRIHYYAHLRDINIEVLSWAARNRKIGTVGTTGNAKGKPSHLHYSIVTIIPYPWKYDNNIQGWKKMFFLNPIDFLLDQR
jgi:peptidoglycan LD-endopeptidase LytH